jgi:hypothetical protein
MNRILTCITGFAFMVCAMLMTEGLMAQTVPNEMPDRCESWMGEDYLSDGQDYTARLNKNNAARFHTVFYGGNRYFIAACSNIKAYPLIMKVYDSERNLLFDNTRHNHTPYWHLAFTSTVACVVEIRVEAEQHLDQLVKLMIGFQKPQKAEQRTER